MAKRTKKPSRRPSKPEGYNDKLTADDQLNMEEIIASTI
jgi:hypothetical protein